MYNQRKNVPFVPFVSRLVIFVPFVSRFVPFVPIVLFVPLAFCVPLLPFVLFVLAYFQNVQVYLCAGIKMCRDWFRTVMLPPFYISRFRLLPGKRASAVCNS